MSVLRFPRLYFRGFISWDPGLTNNDTDIYDAINAELILPPDVTYDTFKEWAIENDAGSWNYYGTHTCQFVPARTVITGGVLEPGGGLITDDPLVGKPVALNGKLVDLDPAAVWNSQIYFDDFSIGDGQAGITARQHHRMHSRWINFTRILERLDIAGNAAVVWQTVFPPDNLTIDNPSDSLLLDAINRAMSDSDAQGLMMRFSTYRTLYFQNGIMNDIAQQPRTLEELREAYQAGHIFSNPAYSVVAGVIGIWNRGELASVPEGRYLVPAAPVQAGNVAGSRRFFLGPCVAEVDRAQHMVSLDFNSTVPEINSDLIKADLEVMTLAVINDEEVTTLATIEPAQYRREAYEAQAGIIDISLAGQEDASLFDKIESGQLVIAVQQNGQAVLALGESLLTVQADQRDVYLDEGIPQEITLYARQRGKPAPAGTQILIAKYDRGGLLIAAATRSPEILEVDSDGKATLVLTPSAPGFINIGLFPFASDEAVPRPPGGLDITLGFFISVRTLPFDDELETRTADSQLTWPFVYENILRVYDLLNPVMSSLDIGLPLSDQTIWTNPVMAGSLKEITRKENIESFRYMPVTRALSSGKRKLLHRWCDLVIGGHLPLAEGIRLEESVEESLIVMPFSKRMTITKKT